MDLELDKKAKKREYDKAYNLKNKEKKKLARRQYYKDYRINNIDHIKKIQKIYYDKDSSVKARRMYSWTRFGCNNVNDEMYDYFMNCNNCEICNKEFLDGVVKCLHHHDGDFKNIICKSCVAKE